MAFINPLILFGLIAAAIPLLVHLFNFRRPQRLDYSSLALLQALQRTTLQRIRIRNWLLLLLRMLALCTLVVAFARPTLTDSSGTRLLGRSSTSAVLVLDASLSMMQRDSDGTRLGQAKSAAQAIIQSAEPGDELFMLSEKAQYLETTDVLVNRGPTPATQTAASTIRSAGALVAQEASHLDKIVYYLGDMQESTLLDSVQIPLDNGVRVVLVPVGATETRPNVGITDVQVTSRIVDLDTPATIEATVVNHGNSSIDDYAVSLYFGDERVAQTSIALAPEIPVRVMLRGAPTMRGWLAGHVMTEDDGFEEDNRRYFTLNVPARRDILLVHGAEAQTDHIELALSLRSESDALRTTKIPQRALAATLLSQYSAIFLISPDELSTGEMAKLEQYIQDGGGVLIFPAAEPTPTNAFLEVVGAGRVSIQESETSIDEADFEHPLFEGVFTASERVQRLEAVTVYRSARYVPGVTGAEHTLITLLGGAPLLQEIQFGNGRIFFLAVAPDLGWSDLPVRGLFVPLMYRAAHYLSAGGSVQGEQLLAGHQTSIRIPAVQGNITVKAPDGTELMPPQRQVFGASLLDLDMDSPGVAEVLAADASVRLLSVGLDPRESRLVYMEPEEARKALAEALGAPVELLNVTSGEGVSAAVNRARTGLELWRHFLVLGLVLLAAEMMLAARWQNR
ncbi:MAG: BatA domain-containing protein [Bacteroidetes bacterium]|nr:BatA domain-containing protein [Bacteroidota bacterium]